MLYSKFKCLLTFPLVYLFIFGCQKKELPQKNDQKVVSKPNSKPSAIPLPDSNTFFPLNEGSYWVYESVQNGEKVEGSREIDSVIFSSLTDSGYFATIQEKSSDGEILKILYKVDADGNVFTRRGNSTTFELFCSLNPSISLKIQSKNFFHCSEGDALNQNCFLLQPYPGDKNDLTEEEKASWTGLFFEKGKGLVSNAGVEISQDLVEYRIGLNGPILKLK